MGPLVLFLLFEASIATFIDAASGRPNPQVSSWEVEFSPHPQPPSEASPWEVSGSEEDHARQTPLTTGNTAPIPNSPDLLFPSLLAGDSSTSQQDTSPTSLLDSLDLAFLEAPEPQAISLGDSYESFDDICQSLGILGETDEGLNPPAPRLDQPCNQDGLGGLYSDSRDPLRRLGSILAVVGRDLSSTRDTTCSSWPGHSNPSPTDSPYKGPSHSSRLDILEIPREASTETVSENSSSLDNQRLRSAVTSKCRPGRCVQLSRRFTTYRLEVFGPFTAMSHDPVTGICTIQFPLEDEQYRVPEELLSFCDLQETTLWGAYQTRPTMQYFRIGDIVKLKDTWSSPRIPANRLHHLKQYQYEIAGGNIRSLFLRATGNALFSFYCPLKALELCGKRSPKKSGLDVLFDSSLSMDGNQRTRPPPAPWGAGEEEQTVVEACGSVPSPVTPSQHPPQLSCFVSTVSSHPIHKASVTYTRQDIFGFSDRHDSSTNKRPASTQSDSDSWVSSWGTYRRGQYVALKRRTSNPMTLFDVFSVDSFVPATQIYVTKRLADGSTHYIPKGELRECQSEELRSLNLRVLNPHRPQIRLGMRVIVRETAQGNPSNGKIYTVIGLQMNGLAILATGDPHAPEISVPMDCLAPADWPLDTITGAAPGDSEAFTPNSKLLNIEQLATNSPIPPDANWLLQETGPLNAPHPPPPPPPPSLPGQPRREAPENANLSGVKRKRPASNTLKALKSPQGTEFGDCWVSLGDSAQVMLLDYIDPETKLYALFNPRTGVRIVESVSNLRRCSDNEVESLNRWRDGHKSPSRFRQGDTVKYLNGRRGGTVYYLVLKVKETTLSLRSKGSYKIHDVAPEKLKMVTWVISAGDGHTEAGINENH